MSSPGVAAEEPCGVCGGAFGEASRCHDCGAPREAGGFRILRLLAKTPHSRMFLAEKHGQKVALKELLFALVPDAQQLDAFEREAALLRQLKHPQIPRFIDSFREGSGAGTRLYLAQEFVEGRSLLDELRDHRFDEREATQIAREVLGVLEYLHGRSPQVIHRDLKPANLMRRSDGKIMVVDFGAARDLTGGVSHGATLVGTFGYMPPEQLGGTVDATCDLYALGATLLHLLSQKPPDALIHRGVELHFRDEVNVSETLAAFLEKLVKVDRRERFQTAAEALAALDTPATAATAPVRRRRLARFVVAGAIGVILLNIGVAAVLLTASEPTAPVTVSPAPVVVSTAPGASTHQPVTRPVPPPPPPSPRLAPRPPVPAGFEVVEVETRPAAAKVAAKPAFQLSRDWERAIEEPVVMPARGDGACEAVLTFSRVALKAGGGERLNRPVAKLFVDGRIEGPDADRACGSTYVSLHGDTAQASDSRYISGQGGATRTLEFPVARETREVELRVGYVKKPAVRLRIDLVTGEITRR